MRLALVTGGGGGLGAATARRFAEDGLTVIVTDIDGAAASKVAAGLPGQGHQGLELDVAREDDVAEVFRRVEHEAGPLSVLIMFAGFLGMGGAHSGVTLMDQDLADWERVFAVNTRGTFLCLRAFARHRRDRPVEHARVITITSLAGQMGGLQSGAAYSASKAAILGLTKRAARELAPLGITVNAIAPGPIDTPMLAGTSKDGETKYLRLDAVPLGRIGEADEIAAAASYLASPSSGFTTGATIDVNGGLLMR